MKSCLVFSFVLAAIICQAQTPAPAKDRVENLIIITTDGFRWQDLFKGMDSAIATNKKFNQGDSTYLFKKYWDPNEADRRKKLLPFLWSTVAAKGQLYGNRSYGNKVDNANPYWFSYPGYSEIMTGYADTAINSNDFPPNPHVTVLEFLNQQPQFKNKVAAFGAWEAFNRILNEKRSGIPVIAAFDASGGKTPTPRQKLLNGLLADSYKPWLEEECLDVFTHYAALEELQTKKPKVLYIAYGETDEWAHSGMYRSYLDAAHQVDAWIKQIWDYVQSDPQYRNKTALFITTDHGRGDAVKSEWTSHGSSIKDAHQIWMAVLAPTLRSKGEVKEPMQVYQQQFAQTMAALLGLRFTASHPVAQAVESVLK